MQYILSEEEHSMVQGMAKRIEQLENENKTLREFNSKKRSQIDDLQEQLKRSYMETFRVRTNLQDEIKRRDAIISEMKRDLEGTEQALRLACIQLDNMSCPKEASSDLRKLSIKGSDFDID